MDNYFIAENLNRYYIHDARFCTVGTEWNANSWNFRLNPTGYHALYYRTDGENTRAYLHMSNNTTVELLSDKIYFIPAFSVIRSEINGEMQKYYIHFQSDYIDFGLYQYTLGKCYAHANHMTAELFNIIVKHYREKNTASKMKVRGAMDILLSDLLNNIAIQPKLIEKFNPVFSFIENHFNEKITLKDLAETINLSTAYFANSFKDTFHISPKQYILGIRLAKSQELLIQTDMSVKEIAEKVGFENENYFSEYFSKKIGISALKFRNYYRNSI